MSNRHIGSNFDDFLENENILEHAITIAKMRILTTMSHLEQSPKIYLKQSEKDRKKLKKRTLKKYDY